MLKIIDSVFKYHEYNLVNANKYHFYQLRDTTFWLVKQIDNDDDIKALLSCNQMSWFNECKVSANSEYFDKNASLLILWDTGDGQLGTSEFKQTKIQIEEDPYFFKKYVIGYSRKQCDELKSQIGTTDPTSFIRENIFKKGVFDAYKDEIEVHTWRSLLYRLTIKLPFFKIDAEELKTISLLSQNALHVEARGLKKDVAKLENLMSGLSLDQIEDKYARELCELLSFGGDDGKEDNH